MAGWQNLLKERHREHMAWKERLLAIHGLPPTLAKPSYMLPTWRGLGALRPTGEETT